MGYHQFLNNMHLFTNKHNWYTSGAKLWITRNIFIKFQQVVYRGHGRQWSKSMTHTPLPKVWHNLGHRRHARVLIPTLGYLLSMIITKWDYSVIITSIIDVHELCVFFMRISRTLSGYLFYRGTFLNRLKIMAKLTKIDIIHTRRSSDTQRAKRAWRLQVLWSYFTQSWWTQWRSYETLKGRSFPNLCVMLPITIPMIFISTECQGHSPGWEFH